MDTRIHLLTRSVKYQVSFNNVPAKNYRGHQEIPEKLGLVTYIFLDVKRNIFVTKKKCHPKFVITSAIYLVLNIFCEFWQQARCCA